MDTRIKPACLLLDPALLLTRPCPHHYFKSSKASTFMERGVANLIIVTPVPDLLSCFALQSHFIPQGQYSQSLRQKSLEFPRRLTSLEEAWGTGYHTVDRKEVWFVRHTSLDERKRRCQGKDRVGRQAIEAGVGTPDTGSLLCLISVDSNGGGVTFRDERKDLTKHHDTDLH